MRLVAYPIPQCDSAVYLTFSDGCWMWLWDTLQGYHQIDVEPASQEKLAFAGPNATKWTYNVMPFGPMNGLAIFIAFVHDGDSSWKELARSYGISIDKDTNTNIIVEDILSWAKSLQIVLIDMECQLNMCLSQNLSLSLKKLHIFRSNLSFLGSMYAPTAINLQCQSIKCSTTGHCLLLFATLPSLLVSCSSIHVLFPILKSGLHHFAN